MCLFMESAESTESTVPIVPNIVGNNGCGAILGFLGMAVEVSQYSDISSNSVTQ